MAEWRLAGQTKRQEGKGSGSRDRSPGKSITWWSLVEGWGQESQSTTGGEHGKDTKKGSHRMSDRKQRSEKAHSLMNTTINLVTTEEEKVEVFNRFCLNLHWQPFPHSLLGRTSKQGMEEQILFPCRRWSSSWPLEENLDLCK